MVAREVGTEGGDPGSRHSIAPFHGRTRSSTETNSRRRSSRRPTFRPVRPLAPRGILPIARAARCDVAPGSREAPPSRGRIGRGLSSAARRCTRRHVGGAVGPSARLRCAVGRRVVSLSSRQGSPRFGSAVARAAPPFWLSSCRECSGGTFARDDALAEALLDGLPCPVEGLCDLRPRWPRRRAPALAAGAQNRENAACPSGPVGASREPFATTVTPPRKSAATNARAPQRK